MSTSPDTTYGLGDYIGDMLAFGLSRDAVDYGYALQERHWEEHPGRSVGRRLTRVLENPTMFVIWSTLELILTVLWLRNPWPFPNDTVTKHPGAIEIFVLLYFVVTVLYFLFFKAKDASVNLDILDPPGVWSFREGSWLLTGFGSKVYATLGSIFLFVLAIVGLFSLIRKFDILYYLVTYTINICIIILGIAFIYLVTKPLFKNWNLGAGNVLGVLKDFILFIPCLFLSAIEWFLQQESGKKLDGQPDPFRARSKLVWLVLLFEVVLIALKFILPVLFNKIVTHDGQHLLKDPVYLNTQHTLGTFENLHGKISASESAPYKYHYSLSSWIYLNPQPPSTNSSYNTYTSLLSYGKKPLIEYNGRTNILRVSTQAGKGKTVTLASIDNVQYQKWNNIVINYDGANMDVFINGELVGSQPNIAPYMSFDDVIAGSTNGIHGGICNVVYYDHPLSKSKINLSYRTLRDKATPIL